MKMKKKFLSVAVLAALGAGSAQAVNLGSDGTGQVLLFPYYTVQGGEETLLSVVNTTDYTKAVKIRFREAYNSREVLDFNIYLSPHDVWVAKVRDAADGGAEIYSADNTCTAPLSISQHVAQPFKTIGFAGGNIDGLAKDSGPQGIERVREGYVEIIEMGVADEAVASIWDNDGDGVTDSIHDSNGVPDNCAGIYSNFSTAGEWKVPNGFPANLGILPPTGGLFGALAIINVEAGTEISVNATALEDVYEVANHYSTGSLNPTLNAAELSSTVFVNDVLGANGVADEPRMLTEVWLRGIDAVSATMMAAHVMNQWTINPAVEAETAWIVAFPTKWGYVDDGIVVAPIAPFTDDFQLYPAVDGKACENVGYSIYDREEQILGSSTCDFSPCPGIIERAIPLCYEVNVLQFGSSNVLSAANTVATITSDNLPGTGINGWMNMDMVYDPNNMQTHRMLGGHEGLPVVGFSASTLGNSNVGVGAAYGTSNPHSYKRVQS